MDARSGLLAMVRESHQKLDERRPRRCRSEPVLGTLLVLSRLLLCPWPYIDLLGRGLAGIYF